MFIGQTASLPWFNYLHLGAGFCATNRLTRKMMSNEELLIILKRHINFNKRPKSAAAIDCLVASVLNCWRKQPHDDVPGEPISNRTNTKEQSWSRGTGTRSATPHPLPPHKKNFMKPESSVSCSQQPVHWTLFSKSWIQPHSPIVFFGDSYYLPINIIPSEPPLPLGFRQTFYTPFSWIPSSPHSHNLS